MENIYKRVYNMVFDPIFLVRFGYYDVSIKNEKVLESPIDLESDYGKSDSFYFKVFNMESFSEYLKNNDLRKYFDFEDVKKIKPTEPVYFSIPKTENSRRQYKMPNLYSYMALNYFICDHKYEFVDIFSQNKYSTSKFFGQLNFDYRTTQEIRQILLYGGTKKLHLDLSNFYHTLYTHSIPWIINGKDQAKKDTTNGFANNLDKLISRGQYNETHGIPTGNLLSKIVAELYMCYFDKRMETEGFIYARYVDDFVFSYTLENEKDRFLKEFSLICRENNLIVNDNKTKVELFPFMNSTNKANVFSFFENLNSKTKTQKWISEISVFIDYCIDQENKGNKGALKALFPVIKNVLTQKKVSKKQINDIFSIKNLITNFNLFEKILDVSLKDSRLTNRFLQFFENLGELGFSSRKGALLVQNYFKNNEVAIREKILFYSVNHYNQELYQLLLYTVVFEDKRLLTKKILLALISEHTDDYSLILTTIIYINRKFKTEELLRNIDQLFIKTHSKYQENSNRMAEQLWLFRYFFYFLRKKEIIVKDEVNRYCKNSKYESNTKGYQTELNWAYVYNAQDNIGNFFQELLENEISLVNCGVGNSFSYLTK